MSGSLPLGAMAKAMWAPSGVKLGLAASWQPRGIPLGPGWVRQVGVSERRPVPSALTIIKWQTLFGGQREKTIRRPSGDQSGRSSTVLAGGRAMRRSPVPSGADVRIAARDCLAFKYRRNAML